jgi:hypothetical protein
MFMEGSLVAQTRRIIQARELSRVGQGVLAVRIPTRGPGSVAMLTKLENNSYLLAITNFNRDESAEYLNLSLVPGLDAARTKTVADIFTGEELRLDRSRLPLQIEGWGTRALHISLNGAAQVRLPGESPVQK